MGLFSGWRRSGAAAVPAVNRNEPDPADLEARSRISDMVRQSDPNLAVIFGGIAGMTDEVVTLDTALEVPAIGSAVGFLSRSLASLPCKVYRKTDKGRELAPQDPVTGLLGRAANDETNHFEWRRGLWTDVFTEGRTVNFIERNGRADPINLWALEVEGVEVERRNGRTLYHYQDGISRRVTYAASEIIDLCFMPGKNRKSARSPIFGNRNTIGLALAVTRYGARFFSNGGIPPFTIEGPMGTPGGVERASQQLTDAVRDAAQSGRNAIAVPDGHKLSPLGVDPEKMQMVEVQRFLIEQFSRIYGLPPVFLQDLTHGTFSNTEQQDLHLVKHVIAQWCGALEAELNLKLWGRRGGRIYAEHVLDALMRGELKSRTEAFAQQINTGQRTINEVRELDNKGPVQGGDKPLIQGAMLPVDQAGAAYTQQPKPEQEPKPEENGDDD